ncbi:MAG TPA: hypothetical protein ENN68_08385 [Methanomicrobia archaeon]|nr:hypothetical protein [Methanomicrobia archaeon]
MHKEQKMQGSGPAGAFYFLGFIGAAVHFIGTATTFWMGVLGFLKAIVWPAFLVYGLLNYIGM